jgi:ferredoxin
MTYVIAEPCIGEKNGACVDVCPAGCIHTTPDAPQNYIDPDVCIECEQCVLVCPVNAVFLDAEIPAEWQRYVAVNADFFSRNRAAYAFSDAEVARIFDAIGAYAARANVDVAIAIVDMRGELVASTGSGAVQQEAERKAYTALSYGLGTHELKASSKPLWLRPDEIDATRVLMAPGGLPLTERGQSIGAVGVSGAGAHDQLCAQAALALGGHVGASTA